ncbi:exodeoxyribonuclease VII large subunit [Bacillus sp. 1NLA3E]|uniref:exodeoxyribonuclease VII large subunit n=1 Tax=Bacillus sp. 1NLA3E TaxID=666686 RepID=UPI000247E4FE|nr:exodeoxyribonuclease VII large subunit [Bacillus sp. 1NLA3E]AGK54836.1 exodeoxyribonuclease VII large subunit [Bacillus sp. 1NLA3E]
MEQRYLTVNALTKYIKRKFDADPHLQDCYVKGEISNFKQHSSGHMYFTLKDDKARLLAIMFASANRSMKFKPENGMQVLVSGDLSVYEASGQYQIYIKDMKPDGVGELFLAFEQLKAKLTEEGLFSPENKLALPKYPKTVGVVTSPTGAAIRDIVSTIKRRYPIANILLLPALVQGDQAAASIAKAIKYANTTGKIDVLIIGRGGGSIEELWAFNEEVVARAIFSSKIPIISAVGHETDFTIADFVADLRAPTPTAAAELAVPHIDELIERILNRQTRMLRAMKEKISSQNERLNRLNKSYAFRYPHKLYQQKLEQLDRQTEQLVRGSKKMLDLKKMQLENQHRRLLRNAPDKKIIEAKEEQFRLKKALNRAMQNILSKKQTDFSHRIAKLEALSPLKVMERGYSLIFTEDQKLVSKVSQVKQDEEISVRLADGSLQCKVIDIKGELLDG